MIVKLLSSNNVLNSLYLSFICFEIENYTNYDLFEVACSYWLPDFLAL